MRKRRRNRVKLPKLTGIVAFHHELRRPNIIVMQVPNEDFSDSDTYELNLRSAEDTGYIIRKKEGLRLLDMVKMHKHVVYQADRGDIDILEDKDEKRTASRFGTFLAEVERKHSEVARRQAASVRKVSIMRNRKPKQPRLPS